MVNDNASQAMPNRQMLWMGLYMVLAIVAAVITSTFLAKAMVQSEVNAAQARQPAAPVVYVPPQSVATSTSCVPAGGQGGESSDATSQPSAHQSASQPVVINQPWTGGQGGELPQTVGSVTKYEKIVKSYYDNDITNTTHQVAKTYYTNSNNTINTTTTHTVDKSKHVTIDDSYNKGSYNSSDDDATIIGSFNQEKTINKNSFNKNSFNEHSNNNGSYNQDNDKTYVKDSYNQDNDHIHKESNTINKKTMYVHSFNTEDNDIINKHSKTIAVNKNEDSNNTTINKASHVKEALVHQQ